MLKKSELSKFAGRLLSGAAVSAIAITGVAAQSISDEIVVTAQRTEQSLQDVPIAVSAFGGDDLQDRQLESFTDIQVNIPNFSFSRSQFTGSSISIRGVGALAVAASSEPSTSIHINDVFISAPRLFETEFYDIERLEILRGPQGTLFGRNATAGVINVHTAKADPSEVGGYIDAEYGNYESIKMQGALNLPITDTLATRIAGTVIKRDGYTENLFTGNDIDDRDIYSIRSSTRWLPTDNTTVDFTASYMREEDKRARWQKQACAAGADQPLLGCSPGAISFNTPQALAATFFANTSAEALALASGSPAAAAFGLFSLAGPIPTAAAQPTDLRQVSVDFEPKYDAEESVFLLNIKHDFENFSFKLNAGMGNSKIATRTDFDGGVGPTLTVPPAIATLPGVAALYSGGTFPISDFDVGIEGPSNGLCGVICGNEQARSNRYGAIDLSIGETDYWSVEGIIASDFDGPINFLAGASIGESNGFADYLVATTGLDYFSVVLGTLGAVAEAQVQGCALTLAGGGTPTQGQIDGCTDDFGSQPIPAQVAGGNAAAGAAAQGFSLYSPYFFTDTDDNNLETLAFFGEVYYDISDTLKLTGGIRHNRDTKSIRDRSTLLVSVGATPGAVPLGTPNLRPIFDSDELNEGTAGAVSDFRVDSADFNATTGRAVLQWTPSDNAQFYASWTRGYKPGGFNPRSPTSPGQTLTFDPEIINAYEVGVKSSLLDGALRANLTGFYYDYSGLQISRIVENTSINDNVNATIFGVEGEFVYNLTDNLVANMNMSYLNTEIQDFSTIDVRNPTAGSSSVQLLADITFGNNCVIQNNGAPNIIDPSVTLASLSPLLAGASPELAAGFDALTASPFTICNSLQGILNDAQLPLGPMGALISLNQALGTNYQILPGVETDATGNALPGSPEFSVGGGLQYTMYTGNNIAITPRVDAYYQSEMYTNIFNTAGDLVDGYAQVNAQLKIEPSEDGNWYVRFFVQNLTNNDATTGQYNVGQGAGNFTNVFLMEPRRYGVGVGLRF